MEELLPESELMQSLHVYAKCQIMTYSWHTPHCNDSVVSTAISDL